MELSEINELRRVLKTSAFPKDPLHSPSLPGKMIDYDINLQEDLKHSPPCSIPNDLSNSLPEEFVVQPTIFQEPVKVVPETELQVEKIHNFKEEYFESITKISTLTQSILEETNQPKDRRRSSERMTSLINLTIYLFGTHETLELSVPIATTIEQLIIRIIAAYLKSDMQKDKPLPKGPIAEAYQIWLIDDENCFPDTDFTIEKSRRVKDLDTEKLAFCAISGLSYNTKNKSVLNKSTIISGIPLKIFFEDVWIVAGIDPKCLLRDILGVIEVKLKIPYMNPSEYEFRVEVSLDGGIEKEECIVDMDLPVISLSTDELRLYKKVYADTPAEIQSIKKEIPLFREEEDIRYDPSRFNMSRAQACAYKEYEVFKINVKGKRQKRILGINQLRIFNMTVAQSKQAVKEKAITDSEKKLFKTKIASIFKSVTQHPEIPIANIFNVQQDPKNLSALFIDYTENSIKKRKYFETEKSAIAAEIVAKITKLMTLVSS